jgi:hypothetical protein
VVVGSVLGVERGSTETINLLALDSWWDEPGYRAAMETFFERGAFILRKLEDHDAAELKDVLGDLYRDAVPDPMDITKFEWETILRFMGTDAEEIRDVQLRMGRVWR